MEKKEINSKGMFYSGIPFVGAGVVFMAAVNAALGAAFIGIGITFMILGRKEVSRK